MNAVPMWDVQASIGFVRSQTTVVEAEVNRTVYPQIQYPQLVPVDTGGNPFTQTVTYVSADQYGKADWINGNADDIPMAGTVRAQHKTAVYTAAIGYGWGWEEVNYAQMAGVNLPAEDAMAARRAYEEMVDRVALQGDASKGFTGLFNSPGVTVAAPTSGAAWTAGTATPTTILRDINDSLQLIHTATNTAVTADTLLLPFARFNRLATTTFGNEGANTLLDMVMRTNVYTATTGQPLLVRGIRGLDTAGNAGATRMIAYRRSPDVLKMHIPMPHRFLPVYQDGPLHFVVPGVFRLGGLDVRRPKEMLYVDGI